jgi:hypothetical protein
MLYMVQISKKYEKIYSNSLSFPSFLLEWLQFSPSLKGNNSYEKVSKGSIILDNAFVWTSARTIEFLTTTISWIA